VFALQLVDTARPVRNTNRNMRQRKWHHQCVS
jgi:hypothetical protein